MVHDERTNPSACSPEVQGSYLGEVFHLQKVFQNDMALIQDSICRRLLGVCAHSPEHLIAAFPNSGAAQGHRRLCTCESVSKSCVNKLVWTPLGDKLNDEVRKWP